MCMYFGYPECKSMWCFRADAAESILCLLYKQEHLSTINQKAKDHEKTMYFIYQMLAIAAGVYVPFDLLRADV